MKVIHWFTLEQPCFTGVYTYNVYRHIDTSLAPTLRVTAVVQSQSDCVIAVTQRVGAGARDHIDTALSVDGVHTLGFEILVEQCVPARLY